MAQRAKTSLGRVFRKPEHSKYPQGKTLPVQSPPSSRRRSVLEYPPSLFRVMLFIVNILVRIFRSVSKPQFLLTFSGFCQCFSVNDMSDIVNDMSKSRYFRSSRFNFDPLVRIYFIEMHDQNRTIACQIFENCPARSV